MIQLFSYACGECRSFRQLQYRDGHCSWHLEWHLGGALDAEESHSITAYSMDKIRESLEHSLLSSLSTPVISCFWLTKVLKVVTVNIRKLTVLRSEFGHFLQSSEVTCSGVICVKALVSLVPRELWRQRGFSEALANFSLPMVWVTDQFLGRTDERHG